MNADEATVADIVLRDPRLSPSHVRRVLELLPDVRETQQDSALAEAVKDVCWRATQYGQTEDGDTYAYLVTKGAMHRLIGAAQSAGISASFRASASTS